MDDFFPSVHFFLSRKKKTGNLQRQGEGSLSINYSELLVIAWRPFQEQKKDFFFSSNPKPSHLHIHGNNIAAQTSMTIVPCDLILSSGVKTLKSLIYKPFAVEAFVAESSWKPL